MKKASRQKILPASINRVTMDIRYPPDYNALIIVCNFFIFFAISSLSSLTGTPPCFTPQSLI